MKKYLLVSPGYPSEKDKYNCAFVHVRVKHYLERGLNVDVFFVNRRRLGKPQSGNKYEYEGVTIEKGNLKELKRTIERGNFEKILIHFGYKTIVSTALKAAKETPIIIWLHGVDVISWTRRMYNLRLKNVIKFLGYILINVQQRMFLNKIAKDFSDSIAFIFVSDWLKKTAQKDIRSNIKNAYVIPNPIDTKAFVYEKKEKGDRLKILIIRSFANRNYANDVLVKAIIELSKKPIFTDFEFTICGRGRLWKSTIAPLKRFENVHLENRYFSHKEIKELHEKHGVILMPSRQDTHGISTCEGMSSGLVAISSNNSAIPEYVPSSCAYLTDDYRGIVEAIEDIYNNIDKYLAFSRKGAEFIRSKCSSDIVIEKELKIITS